MAARRSYLWPVLTAIVAVAVVLVAAPQDWKTWAPGFLRAPSLHLGLDLAGGTELDFRISEEEINSQLASLDAQIAKQQAAGGGDELAKLEAQRQSIQDQQANLMEAIRAVLERRVNSLGVSEATITPSYFGNEKHLLVEFPGITDIQQAIKVVGKTIQLEFKEEFTEATDEYVKSVRAKADAAYKRITQSGSSLAKEGQDLSSQLGVAYNDHGLFYKDTLPKGLEELWTLQPGKVVMKEASVQVPSQNASGQQTEETVNGIFIAEVVKPKTMTGRLIEEAPKAFAYLAKTNSGASYAAHENVTLDDKVPPRIVATIRSMKPGDLKSVGTDDKKAHVFFLRTFTKGREQIAASHILIQYKGAQNADASVTRTKEQAKAKIDEIKARLAKGEKFEDIARKESDGPSKASGGSLGTFGRGEMVPAFEQAAFKLQKQGDVSDVVETQFGYHIIRLDKPLTQAPDTASYDDLTLAGADPLKTADSLIAKLKAGEVRDQEEAVTLRTLFFSLKPTGWKDTELDGKHFRSANVTVDNVTGIPVVQIIFDTEGGRLFQELTKRNIGKRIAIFVGGELISAPTVNQEISGGTAIITGSGNFDEAKQLASDLNTGAIPAPIHLVGQHTVEATLGSAALATSLHAALIGLAILALYMVFRYRLLGLVADAALLMYALIFFALLKLPLFLVTDAYVVLTVAGMAGIILSIGMAVDANVLVFERMREELRKGKSVRTSVETSFQYAWPAIRDGNVSTLITCFILFTIGTSIVRGFAITLAMGVLLSLFTAVVLSRWMLRHLAQTKLAENTALFGVKRTDAQA